MPTTEVPKRIHLLGSGRHEEFVAAGAITPGHLMEMDSNGKVVVHNSAGVLAERMFALEDALQGGTIDDAYAADDVVATVMCHPGDVVYALLAAGEDAEKGEFLTSNGDGELKVATGSDAVVGVALDNLDLSDSNETEAERIRVRII